MCKFNFGGQKLSNNVAKARMAKAFMAMGWNPEQQVT
jgi:hypothetical protein